MSEDLQPLETEHSNVDVSTNSMDTDPSQIERTAMTETPVEEELQAQAEDILEPDTSEDNVLESSAEILGPDHKDVEADALTQLATEVESLRLQVEERTSQCMRMAADFDNFRKRTDREKSELELRVKRDAISELLPVIDSFERARTQIKPQSEQEVNIHKSYQGVYKQLVDCLKRIGVSPMRVEGEPFDPNYHDAIMREPTDQHPEGTVLEELRRGYLLGDMVLRHAMVKVSALPETDSAASEEESEPSLDNSMSS